MRARTLRIASESLLVLSLLWLGGCADIGESSSSAIVANGVGPSTTPTPDVPGASGLTQSGAQDFAAFRAVLEAGGIPNPDDLDPLGFMAEHKLDYPAPDCGDDVCAHAMLGVMGNFMTGTNCTLLQIGLNSPIDPDSLPRPPMHLVLAIDTSGSMAGTNLTFVKTGLKSMFPYLKPDDRVSIVGFSDTATVFVEHAKVSGGPLYQALGDLVAGGKTNTYDGLFQAFMMAEKHAAEGVSSRVILLTDGSANAGITTPAKLEDLVEGYILQGMGLTTIALGLGADLTQLVGLAELGAGSFYFIADAEDVHEVFTTEAKTTLYPLAVDVEIRVAMGPGYWLRAVYGTKGWSGDTKGGLAKIPALFLAKRQSSEDDIDEGRRGGGGGILLEAMPTFNPEDVNENYRVGTVTFSYTDPKTGERLEQELEVTNPNLPGIIPDGGHFSTKTVEKGFVMLNIFIGFQMATEMAAAGDAGGAIGVLNALASGVDSWLETQVDADIADDLELIEIFVENLHAHGVTTQIVDPPEPWPND